MTALPPHLAAWDRLYARRGWGRYPSEDVVRFLARRFGGRTDRAALRVLDLGCGPGPNLWYLVREGFAAAGIDGSPTAIEQARARLAAEGLADRPVELRSGDFRALPWPDAAFDAVIDNEAIYANDLAAIRATVAELRRVLRPGGAFFGKMFGVRSTGFDRAFEIEPGTLAGPREGPCAGNAIAHFFDEAELRALFGDFAGVTLDHVERTEGGGRTRVFEWLVTAER